MLHTLLFIGSYLGGGYFALFRAPVYAFLTYQMVYFFNPGKRWWSGSIPTLSYSFYTVALMAIVLALNWKKLKENKILATPQAKWVYLFLILHLIASNYAALPLRHELYTTFFLKLVITISIAYMLIDSIKHLNLAIIGYVFGAWYLSFYIYQIGRNSGDRVEGIGTVDSPESNGVAAALAPAIIFGIYYLWRGPNLYYKFMALIATAFTCNALILINSRGAVLGVAVGAMYFMFQLFRAKIKKGSQRAMVIVLCIGGLAGVISIADDTFLDRIITVKSESEGTKDNKDKGESGSTRVIFWMAAYELAKDHPFGTGAYGFNYFSKAYIPKDTVISEKLESGGGYKSVHSSWFSTLAEVGFPGGATLLLIFYSSFRALGKCQKVQLANNDAHGYYLMSAIKGAFITIMVCMTFLDRHRSEILYWLVLFGMASYNVYVLKNNQTSDS
jgi:hypothetical protein